MATSVGPAEGARTRTRYVGLCRQRPIWQTTWRSLDCQDVLLRVTPCVFARAVATVGPVNGDELGEAASKACLLALTPSLPLTASTAARNV
jgi:hypothetical protein